MTSLHRHLAHHLRQAPSYLKYSSLHEFGVCHACGHSSVFLASGNNLKESLNCAYCGAWQRIRFISELLLETYSQASACSLRDLVREPLFSSLDIYEAAAQGALHERLKHLPGYVCSEYFEDCAPGRARNGVRCEDLQQLTFADAQFDLVLHTSVLEHVRRPQAAIAESFRVLKPGGILLFEVPLTEEGVPGVRARTVSRVDTRTDNDIFLMKKAFHGDPLRNEGVLVYTDFGIDLADQLAAVGFEVSVRERELAQSSMSHAIVFMCRKP